ncbi:MAG: flagellar motor switch protein FliG [Candidatus Sumerlaeota bacterium]|nr:flagellar motor switch protein FliG [Candidatus Sumerlaeota bacterium]
MAQEGNTSEVVAARKAQLTGADKAAILLLSLDESVAAEILKRLDTNDVQRLTQKAARLRNIAPEDVRNIQREFTESIFQQMPVISSQSKDAMISLIYKAFPKNVADGISEYLEKGAESFEGLETLKWLDASSIASFIRNEYPQTQAIILAHLEPRHASEVLSQLPEKSRAEVITRLATLDRINPTILHELDEVIKVEMLASGATQSSQMGGVTKAAEIMNFIDKASEAAIFSQIEETDASLVESIRELMFVFEDLVSIDDRGMQQIMKEVSNDVLTLALKTASEELKTKMFRNISQRAAQMITEELEVMGPVKLSDVERAQQEIVKIARRLEEEGKIVLSTGGSEAFV